MHYFHWTLKKLLSWADFNMLIYLRYVSVKCKTYFGAMEY